MATEISNGSQTVKLYQSVNRGKAMYQLAYYMGGRRVQKNFADKAEAKRVAKQILGGLTNDAEAVEALATPELESLVAARRVLAPNYALHVAVEEHAQAVGKLGEISLREAVEFFLRHNRADVPRLTLAEIAEQFAKSREQSGLSAHYVSQCRKTVNDLAKAFPGKTLPDLRTTELDAWLGGLKFGAKTKNGIRIILVACGNWAEGRGYLIKGGSPFPAMVRYKETKTSVSIFTPENIASLLTKADNTLRPFLALGAFAGLRTAELQRLDWKEIDLDRGFITVDANKAKTRQRRLVPISDNLKLWLTPCKQTSGPVCLHQRPQIAAARLCEGFVWQENGLRHSFISYRLAVLHDTARVALEAGNSPEVIFGHYRELVTPEAAQAWFAVKPAQGFTFSLQTQQINNNRKDIRFMTSPQPARDLGHLILTLRGQRVLLDADLAALYGVSTGNLNKAVRRNLDRFPEDFMFQLNAEEVKALSFQSGISKKSRGGRRYLPYAFTQEGVAMLSSVLSSPRAVQVNIAIMRTFIRLRQMVLSVDELSRKVADLERGYKQHGQQFDVVFKAIRQLMAPPPAPPHKKIGF